MAKYERRLHGNFSDLLSTCEEAVSQGSLSASYEDGSDYSSGNLRVSVRVFERYSYFGGNRLSMNLTIVGDGEDLFLFAITAGGSQAIFFKINTIGEESFLDTLVSEIERKYPRS